MYIERLYFTFHQRQPMVFFMYGLSRNDKKIEILNERNEQQPTVSGFQFSLFFRRKFNTYMWGNSTNTLNIKGVAKIAFATLELFSNKKLVSILIGASKRQETCLKILAHT
jgi:hypothetical protein